MPTKSLKKLRVVWKDRYIRRETSKADEHLSSSCHVLLVASTYFP